MSQCRPSVPEHDDTEENDMSETIESAEVSALAAVIAPAIDAYRNVEQPYEAIAQDVIEAGWRRSAPDTRLHRTSVKAWLPVYLHMRDGSTRTIEFDCNSESAFEALERAYRATDGTDFNVSDVASITFRDA